MNNMKNWVIVTEIGKSNMESSLQTVERCVNKSPEKDGASKGSLSTSFTGQENQSQTSLNQYPDSVEVRIIFYFLTFAWLV